MVEIETYCITDDGERAEVQIKAWDGTRWLMSGKYPIFGEDMFRRLMAEMLDDATPHEPPLLDQ